MAENPMTPPSRKRSREDTEQETPSKKARFDRDARVTTADPRTKAHTAIPACDKANTTGEPPRETSKVQVGEPSSPGSTKNDKVKLPKQHRDAFVDSEPSNRGNIIPDTTATKVTSKEASDKVRLDPRRKTLKKLATPEELLELDTEEGINRVAQKYLASAASKKRKLDHDVEDSSPRELGRATKKQRTADRSAAKILPRGKNRQPPSPKASKKAQTPRSSSTISTASATSSGPSSASIASAKPARKGLTTLQEAHQKVQAEQAEKAEKAAEKETAEPEVSKNKVYDADSSGSRYGGITSTQQQLKPTTSAPAPAAVQASGPPIRKQPYPPPKKKLDFYTNRVPLTAEQLTKADLKRAGERLTRPSREPTAYSRRQAAERRKQVNEALMPESKRKQPLSSASGSSNQKPLLPAKTDRKARQKSPASETDDESIENRPITSPARPAPARKESASSSGSQTSSTGAFKKPDSRLEALRRKYSASVSDDNLPSRRSS
ncbi:hypothetical protein LTR70_000803 [Exophiala xenobiotica]|uniref:Uncharacterized protein n=1 Tax=Lithohypha guttulata TaxID=1690604 RepID=A0ABR0KN43_9EURO|nr:hypothetical protein LTR24_000524 [Lithohypha guttulata]KAK5329306.1 hypothetical protein LTR70_000803 [Exophiala xenobiotica]